jgi:hypothetical protein
VLEAEVALMPKKMPKKLAKKSQRGGKRAGAGRKRDRLPQAMIDRVGPVPTTPAELDFWIRKLLAELLVLQMTGEVAIDLAASIRMTVAEIRKGMPSASAKPDDDDDDDDDDEFDGPELEDIDDEDDDEEKGVDHGAIRVE